MGALPDFVEPMLAKLGREPFDSDEHFFELKWDGIRGLAFLEAGARRILSRNRNDMTARYPELRPGFQALAKLEDGLVLDGELVALLDGRPNFQHLMSREQARAPQRIQALSREIPVSYVVFDVLYRHHESLMDRALVERREHLTQVVDAAQDPRIVLSEGIVGGGCTFFEQTAAMELEGMVAKRLSSPYLSGQRTDAWTKVKRRMSLLCAILGYDEDLRGDLKSLILASEVDGKLQGVGKVGSGLGEVLRARLLKLLRARPRAQPLVQYELPRTADMRRCWVEPGLYCTVSFVERTSAGSLRAPVFLELVEDGG